MDADTRHQLRQNELAEALAKLRDFSDKRTIAWLAVILAIGLAYGGYKLWDWRERVHLARSFEALTSVNATDARLGEAPLAQLRQLIADNSQPGLVALSRLQLALGLETRGQRADAGAKLAEAEAEYQKILGMPDAPAHTKAAALYRLGMLYETKRDFAKARELYTTLSKDTRFDGSPLMAGAAARLSQLDGLAVLVKFEPGAKPLPAAQPTTPPAPGEEAPGPETTDVAPGGSPPTESSEPQQP